MVAGEPRGSFYLPVTRRRCNTTPLRTRAPTRAGKPRLAGLTRGQARAGGAKLMARRCGVRHAGLVVVEVRRIGSDGSIRRVSLDTAGRVDASWWERLADSCWLEVPPPYRAVPGQPVYEVCAGDRVAQVAGELLGPLRELVTALLAQDGAG